MANSSYISLKKPLFLLKHRWPFLVLPAFLLGGCLSIVTALTRSVTFEASSSILINTNSASYDEYIKKTAIEFASSTPVLELANHKLGDRYPMVSLEQNVRSSGAAGSLVVTITVIDKSGNWSVELANACADAVVELAAAKDESGKFVYPGFAASLKPFKYAASSSKKTAYSFLNFGYDILIGAAFGILVLSSSWFLAPYPFRKSEAQTLLEGKLLEETDL